MKSEHREQRDEDGEVKREKKESNRRERKTKVATNKNDKPISIELRSEATSYDQSAYN